MQSANNFAIHAKLSSVSAIPNQSNKKRENSSNLIFVSPLNCEVERVNKGIINGKMEGKYADWNGAAEGRFQ